MTVSLLTICGIKINMTSAANINNDSWIALEGVGTIVFCLRCALTAVKEEASTQTLHSLTSDDMETVLDSFGQAVLDAQTDAQVTWGNLHASLVGSAGCYNRIGQNWRIVGDKDVVVKQGSLLVGIPDIVTGNSEESPGLKYDSGSMTFTSQTLQILTYGDR
jgi:hypothetical protein